MKRHFQIVAEQGPTLSVEEEAILSDASSEAEAAVDLAAAEVERIGEVSDVANDAMLVVSGVPEVGKIEAELVSAVAEMAVAGTDANPEEVLAVSSGDGMMTTEGIVSALQAIWRAIVTAIKNLWVGLKHWLTTYFSTLEQNRKHAEELIKKLDGMKGFVPNIKNESITITDIFGYGGTYKALSKLFGGVDSVNTAFQDFTLQVITTQPALMGPIGEGLVAGYKEFDGTNIDILGNVVDTLHRKMTDYCKKLGLTSISTKDDKYEHRVAFMSVTAKGFSPKIAAEANSMETKIAYLARIRFEASQLTDFVSTNGINFQNDVSPDILKGVVQKRLDFIQKLIQAKGGDFKALETQAEHVEKACEEMLSRIKEDNKDGQAMAKRLMPLVSAYANWATQPAAKVMSLASRHNKFWLSLAEMTSNNFVAASAE
jgi:hypothetical protein